MATTYYTKVKNENKWWNEKWNKICKGVTDPIWKQATKKVIKQD